MTGNSRINTAIFGGKFDPPHLGHQLSVFLALEKYKFDEVWIIPSFSHPFGYHPGDFDLRIEMCGIMAQPFGKRAKVLGVEKEIGLETVYTVNLIEYLKERFPENDFSLLIGSDNWNVRDKWKNFDKIEEMCRKVVVIGRGESKEKGFALPDISSTTIKEMLKKGENPENLLPAGIYEYILEHGLYGSGKGKNLRFLVKA
ncbi:nicotinate-nicotinamide nucleotide adenylyltransferase [bacterium]|nr:nicotinate-nicotinamide nucleotide adenylyltransferase [bacterium]